MLRVLPLLLVATCAPRSQPAAAPRPEPAPEVSARISELERTLAARIATEPGEYAVVVLDVGTGRHAAVNERLVLHAASTMKVPVLYELYRQGDAGLVRLDSLVEVRNHFRSIADSSHFYGLSEADDSESDLYARVGQRLPLRELARRMIVRSSNLATNNLIDILGAENVQATVERLGGAGMSVRRGVEDTPAYRAGLNNTTDAAGYARVLAALARCELLTAASCAEAIAILEGQEFNEMLPAGLPAGTRFAHKTGWITGIQHDGGIVLPEAGPPFVIVLLSRGGASEAAVRTVAADVARAAWGALGPGGTATLALPARTAALVELHERYRLPAFTEPRLAHDELWTTLAPLLRTAPHLPRETLATSAEGRAIELIRFGTGPVPVLLWSQMHGDETTATRALADLLHYLAREPDSEHARRWQDRLSVLMVPMLNPDGAERYQRRNRFGIDVNRDARGRVTPEGRILKSLQERFRPAYGFNLHDQNPRTRVGESSRLAAISLLAPPPDGSGRMTPRWESAQRLASHIGLALEPLVAGHITRYDDSFNPRAFGDLMAQWDVGTVLIESGGWGDDPVKRWLRTANFVALVEALDAIATDAHRAAPLAWYRELPENGSAVRDLLVRGGQIVLEDAAPYRADLVVDFDGGQATIADIGDLEGSEARDTLDAAGLYIRPQDTTGPLRALNTGPLHRLVLRGTAADSGAIRWEVDAGGARRLN
jgi:beta-lactamase class A